VGNELVSWKYGGDKSGQENNNRYNRACKKMRSQSACTSRPHLPLFSTQTYTVHVNRAALMPHLDLLLGRQCCRHLSNSNSQLWHRPCQRQAKTAQLHCRLLVAQEQAQLHGTACTSGLQAHLQECVFIEDALHTAHTAAQYCEVARGKGTSFQPTS
jgi:hypothetical protein